MTKDHGNGSARRARRGMADSIVPIRLVANLSDRRLQSSAFKIEVMLSGVPSRAKAEDGTESKHPVAAPQASGCPSCIPRDPSTARRPPPSPRRRLLRMTALSSHNRTGTDSMSAEHRSVVQKSVQFTGKVHSIHPDARSIVADARSIHPEVRSIHPDVHSNPTDARSIVPDARSIHADGHSGPPASHSAVSDGRSIHAAVHSAHAELDSGVPDARSDDAATHSAAGNFHQTSPATRQTNPRT